MSAGTIETRHASASTLWLHFFALEDCVLYVHSARSYTGVLSTNSISGTGPHITTCNKPFL